MVSLEQANQYPSVDKIIELADRNREIDPSFPRFSNRDYVNRVKNKILNERRSRLDHELVNHTIANIEDEFNENIAILAGIMRDKTQTAKTRVDAARTIAQVRNVLTQMKFDAGVFDRKLGTLVAETTADKIIRETLGYDRGKVINDARPLRQLPAGNARPPALPIPTQDS